MVKRRLWTENRQVRFRDGRRRAPRARHAQAPAGAGLVRRQFRRQVEDAQEAAVPPRAKAAPEAPKPVEPEPDPHAGHDMDKK